MEGTQVKKGIMLLSESTICFCDSGEVKFGITQLSAHCSIYKHKLSPLSLFSC